MKRLPTSITIPSPLRELLAQHQGPAGARGLVEDWLVDQTGAWRLAQAGKEVLHFDRPDLVDLRLGRRAIRIHREDQLKDSRVTIRGQSDWVNVRVVSPEEAVPAILRAEYRGDFKVHLVFHDGIEGTVDFADWLEGPVFDPLRDQALFQRFFIEAGRLVWPNGADIAPETLYETVKSTAAV